MGRAVEALLTLGKLSRGEVALELADVDLARPRRAEAWKPLAVRCARARPHGSRSPAIPRDRGPRTATCSAARACEPRSTTPSTTATTPGVVRGAARARQRGASVDRGRRTPITRRAGRPRRARVRALLARRRSRAPTPRATRASASRSSTRSRSCTAARAAIRVEDGRVIARVDDPRRVTRERTTVTSDSVVRCRCV
jgi:hypothetical protein